MIVSEIFSRGYTSSKLFLYASPPPPPRPPTWDWRTQISVIWNTVHLYYYGINRVNASLPLTCRPWRSMNEWNNALIYTFIYLCRWPLYRERFSLFSLPCNWNLIKRLTARGVMSVLTEADDADLWTTRINSFCRSNKIIAGQTIFDPQKLLQNLTQLFLVVSCV